MDSAGVAHVAFGLAALAFGVGVLGLRKGTNLHRAVGALYVFSMFGLNTTAMLIYRVFGRFGAFHVLALISMVLVLAGFATAMLQRPRNVWLAYHYYLMGWSYVGLLAATATEITVRVVMWPLAPAVLVPTIAITLGGGALVRVLRRPTMARLARRASSAASL